MRERAGSALRYGSHLAARVLPSPPLSQPWRLRHLMRYRLFTAGPQRIRHRLVGPAEASQEERARYRLELVERFRRDWVLPGEWDLAAEAFGARDAIEEVLLEQFGLLDDPTVQRLAAALEEDDPARVRGGDLPAEVEDYLVGIVRLAASLRREGVRPQRELRGRPTSDEITVALSRHGEPILMRGGNHRVTLARYLELPTVPVLVCGVHEQWLAQHARTHGTGVAAVTRALARALAPGPVDAPPHRPTGP